MEEIIDYCTVFAYDGAVRVYEDGTIFSLKSEVDKEEWDEIIKETVNYKIFLDCLKEVAIPLLDEKWLQNDEWWRLQLEDTLVKMKEIDPLPFMLINQTEIRTLYSEKMLTNAIETNKAIANLRNARGGPETLISSL